MDFLWSPWRHDYISGTGGRSAGCVFCQKAAGQNDEDNLIVYRGKHAFVLLNLFPYAAGHVLIAPYEHVATVENSSPEAWSETCALIRRTEAVLRRVYGAPGYNIGMNIGESAGAGVAQHIHVHVLPRWAGDVNFMTAIGETRVLPEDLKTTWKKLHTAFAD